MKSEPIFTSESGPVLYARHFSWPVLTSNAVTRPRTPNSPPEMPAMTVSLITIGALVIVEPSL